MRFWSLSRGLRDCIPPLACVCLLLSVWALALTVQVDLTKSGSSVPGFCMMGFALLECQASSF